jgi:hypothetical protein
MGRIHFKLRMMIMPRMEGEWHGIASVRLPKNLTLKAGGVIQVVEHLTN